MTDSNPETPTSMDEILTRYVHRRERMAALHSANKTLLFAALAEAGVTTVEIRFDGAGDSGQIEQIEARAEEDSVELPATQVDTMRIDYASIEPISEVKPLPDAIEALCYALLETGHGGWEINEGAFGEFSFDVAAGTITLGFNQRIETSDYTEHHY